MLNKENELYGELSEKDIIELEKYSGYESACFDDLLDKAVSNFENDNGYIFTENMMKERIKERLSVYQYINMFDDKDWYNNIYKGVYLTKNNENLMKEMVNYIYIKSLCTTLSYINVDSNLESSNIKLLWKYLFIYNEPFIENYVINSNFKISDDDYIIKLSSLVNQTSEYVTASREIYSCYLSEICGEILGNEYKKVNDYFLINLNCIKSFLAIINEDCRWELVNLSNDILKEMGYPESECINMYFNLFDECQYVKKKV